MNNSSLKNLQFIFSSKIRYNILLSLFDSNKSLNGLEKDLKTNPTTILHKIKDLLDLGLVMKNSKIYSLSTVGEIFVTNIIQTSKKHISMESNHKFWSEHSLEGINPIFYTYIDIWEDAELFVSDYSDMNKCFHEYCSKIPESSYIKKIVPIFSKFQLIECMARLKNTNSFIELITTRNILDSVKNSSVGVEFFSLVDEGKIELFISSEVDNIYFICTDTFVSLFLFDLEGDYDNLNMLFVTDPVKVKSANELFEIYKNSLI